MSAAWPPPPDLASIQELVCEADVEGLIAEGAPADEYQPEGEAVFNAIAGWTTAELTSERLLPVLTGVWRESFGEEGDDGRRDALEDLASRIERFFGPLATPRTHSV